MRCGRSILMKIAILGTGTIARRFAAAMARVSGSEVSAVLSRDMERAEAFAREVGAARGCCDIEALLASGDVDAVYIGTPNNMHVPQALAVLRHGKPVLCEKPAFMCERDAREVISAAQDSNTLFMEAMWTRTMPGYQAAKRWLDEGRIGKLRSIYASFCFGSQYDPASRLYDPALGGGALYDVGVYALAFALDMAGARPDDVQGMLRMAPSGVDDHDAINLRFGDIIATLHSSISVQQPGYACLYGDKGCIIMPEFWGARHAELKDASGRVIDTFHEDMPDDLYHEAQHFIECCEHGLTQSPLMPHEDSLYLAQLYDRLLRGDAALGA